MKAIAAMSMRTEPAYGKEALANGVSRPHEAHGHGIPKTFEPGGILGTTPAVHFDVR